MKQKKSNKLETYSGKLLTKSQKKKVDEQFIRERTLYDKDRWYSLFEKFKDISEVPKLVYNLDIETLGDGFIYEKKEIEVDGFIYEKKEINIKRLKEELTEIFDVYALLRDKQPQNFNKIKRNVAIIEDFEEMTTKEKDIERVLYQLAKKYSSPEKRLKEEAIESILNRYRSLKKRGLHIKK